MRFSAVLFAAFGALVSCQTVTEPPPAPTSPPTSGNAISAPTAGDVLKAGTPFTIVWDPTTEGPISLILRKGDTDNLDTISPIASNIQNTGSFSWTPEKELEGGSDYAIEIKWPAGSNFSPKFTIDSDGKGVSKTDTSTEASSTTTETETETETATSTSAEETSTISTSPNSTVTRISTSTRAPRPTSTSDPNETQAPDSGSGKLASPLALVLCIGAAMAYLS